MAGAIFIPVAFFHHVVSLLGTLHRFQKFLKVQYGIGITFSFLVWTPFFIKGVAPVSGFLFWPIPGMAFHFSLIWWAFVIIYAHWQLFQAYRHENGVHRKQYRYLLIASAIGFLGGATNFPLWYGIELPPFGNIFVTLYVAIVGYTFLRYHLMEFSVFVEKGLSYFSLLLLVSQPVYPVLLIAQKSILGSISLRYSMVQLLVHVLTVAGAYQMKLGTRGAVARTILKGREYRLKTLNQLSSKVSQVQSVPEIGQAILEAFQHGVVISKAAVYVYQQKENSFQTVATCGFFSDHPIHRANMKLSDDLPQLLLYTQSKVSLRELSDGPFDPWESKVRFYLERLGFDVCYPVFSNYQLVGILALGPVPKEARRILGKSLVWNTLIHESTLALENAILREELLRSQHSLRQIDRLRSVEAMTEGLTHELHNPLMSIKTFVQLAQLRRHDTEFMDTLHRVVGDDLAKIEQLTQEIRAYVKPLAEMEHHKVDITEALESCLLFFSDNPVYKHIQFEKQYDALLPSLTIDRQGLTQVLFNVFLFLLKSTKNVEQPLHVRVDADRRSSGHCWVILNLAWLTQEESRYATAINIGKEDFELVAVASVDGREKRGLFLASQIIQRYSGSLEFLMDAQDQVSGIRIQIPVYSPSISSKMISESPVSAIAVQDS